MFKAKVFKVGVEHPSVGVFDTQELADAWLSEGIANNWWGKPERWLKEMDFTTETVEQALESRLVTPEVGEAYTEYKFASEYTTETVDISAEVAAEVSLSKRLSDQQFGSLFLAKVVELNKAKYIAGSLTLQDLDDMDSDAVLQKLERAAWRGDVKKLKVLVSSYSGTYYSAEEKAMLLGVINNYLGV
jgi:hypothetical protein